MQVNSFNLITTLLSVDSKPSFMAFQIGQVLNALVLGRNEQGFLELKIGAQKITANAPQPLQAGQSLKLLVIENNENLVLQVLGKNNQQATKQLLQQLLRHSLPQHSPPTTLFEKLNAVQLQKNATTLNLPKAVVRQIIETMANIPSKQSVSTSQGLKQALQDSGLFLEARLGKLLHSKQPVAEATQKILKQDFKAGLLSIKYILEKSIAVKQQVAVSLVPRQAVADKTVNKEFPQTVDLSQAKDKTVKAGKAELDMLNISRKETTELIELKRVVDSAIARIQVNQSSAIATEQSQPPVWLIDIPIKDKQEISLAQMRISYDQHAAKDEAAERRWSASLTIELETLGKIHVRVVLSGDEISSSIWAEDNATYRLIEQHIQQLTDNLHRAGLNIDCVNCYPGNAQEASHVEHASQTLVSIRI